MQVIEHSAERWEWKAFSDKGKVVKFHYFIEVRDWVKRHSDWWIRTSIETVYKFEKVDKKLAPKYLNDRK